MACNHNTSYRNSEKLKNLSPVFVCCRSRLSLEGSGTEFTGKKKSQAKMLLKDGI